MGTTASWGITASHHLPLGDMAHPFASGQRPNARFGATCAPTRHSPSAAEPIESAPARGGRLNAEHELSNVIQARSTVAEKDLRPEGER